jgi:hypothetical protein
MSVSDWGRAPRGRYDIAKPRAVRVFLLVCALTYIPMAALGVAAILLYWIRLEGWREWPWQLWPMII